MSNTVGSRETIPKILTARKNLVLKLSQKQFDVLIGSMFGDGYITKLGRIQIEQGENQRDYLLWKYEMLKNITSTKICCAKRQKYSSAKVTTSYRFWTKQYFRPWRAIFYPLGKKIVPEDIKKVLSPLAMAVWFMDDGYLRTKKSIAMSTDKFSTDDLDKICSALSEKFNIKPTIVKSGKLYFGVVATEKFINVVEPFIIPSMCYKIP